VVVITCLTPFAPTTSISISSTVTVVFSRLTWMFSNVVLFAAIGQHPREARNPVTTPVHDIG